MEAINSPEFDSPELGRELAYKFDELMRHPKTDRDSVPLARIQEQYGDIGLDASFEPAYYQEDTGLVAYISIPEPGSRSLDIDSGRYQATLRIPYGKITEEGVEPIFMDKKIEVRVNEVTLAVSCEREDLLYQDNKLIKTENDKKITRLIKEHGILSAYDRYKSDEEEREQLGDFDYSEALHIQVMDVLNSFHPEDEVLDYNPSLGVI